MALTPAERAAFAHTTPVGAVGTDQLVRTVVGTVPAASHLEDVVFGLEADGTLPWLAFELIFWFTQLAVAR